MTDVFTILAAHYVNPDDLSVNLSQAAGATASILSDTLEDFEVNNGLEFKMLINQVKKEAQAMQPVQDESVQK